MTKHPRNAVLACGLAAGLASIGGAAQAQDCTTKIGAVLPTSVDWGKPIAATAQFVVDQVNEAGGVAGCNIELVLRDSQVDPKVGVDAAKALVDLDGVQVLLGAVSSGGLDANPDLGHGAFGRDADVLLFVFNSVFRTG